MSHSAFTGISRHHLGRLVAGLAGPWQARRESALRQRRGADRLRADGAGRRHELVFTDRVLVTLAVLRLQVRHAALAVMFGVDRSTVTRAVHEIRPHAIADIKNWRSLQTLDRPAQVPARDHPGDRLARVRPRRRPVTGRHQPIARPPHRKTS